jgi:hypothetical protein
LKKQESPGFSRGEHVKLTAGDLLAAHAVVATRAQTAPALAALAQRLLDAARQLATEGSAA